MSELLKELGMKIELLENEVSSDREMDEYFDIVNNYRELVDSEYNLEISEMVQLLTLEKAQELYQELQDKIFNPQDVPEF